MIRAAEVLAAALAVLPGQVLGHCAQLVHDEIPYTICKAGADDDLRLFLADGEGATFGSFDRIEADLAAQGLGLGFAMNAGMYHPDRRPVGLYVEAGEKRARIVTAEGPGNFGMLPNGVFCVGERGFAVIESRVFAENPPDCAYATQSGPMLVIDGALHPRFLPESESRLIRNGVGVSPDGARAYFAIADRPVSFHQFGRLFRDSLGTPQALYFDGNVSRLHAPGLGRSDWGRQMGPVVGLVLPQEDAPGDELGQGG